MARKELIKAVAYLRTSSATNVGEDKDSAKRGGASEENQKLTQFLAAKKELCYTCSCSPE